MVITAEGGHQPRRCPHKNGGHLGQSWPSQLRPSPWSV